MASKNGKNGKESTALIKTTLEDQNLLARVGFDVEQELITQQQGLNIQPPRVKIEHSQSGRHRLYVDRGETYLDSEAQIEDLKDNAFEGIVALAQPVRAYFENGQKMPKCAAIGNIPTVIEPLSKSCIGCSYNKIGSPCKPKIRLFVLRRKGDKYEPVIFPLSPTSIKHWNDHIRKLSRQKIPYIAVTTTFGLEDVENHPYRWAEVLLGINGGVSEQELLAIKDFRQTYTDYMQQVHKADFEDPGDVVKPEAPSEPPGDEEIPF